MKPLLFIFKIILIYNIYCFFNISEAKHGYDDVDVWLKIGNTNIEEVMDIVEYKSNIYVLQSFLIKRGVANIVRANSILSWDGKTWQNFLPLSLAKINGIKVLDNKLLVYGIIKGIFGKEINNIGVWDGHKWSSFIDIEVVKKVGMPHDIYDVEFFNNNVYVCGNFNGLKINKKTFLRGIAKWDGTQWQALDQGFNNIPFKLLATKDFLYVGGMFTHVGNKPVFYIAKWDGKQWHSLAGGLDGKVNVLFKDGSDIYIGGNFIKTQLGQQLNYIAKWDGKKWVSLGNGVNYYVSSIAKYKNDIYVAGGFSETASNKVNFIARWDGTNWYSLKGNAINEGYINKILVYKHNLYIGGWFRKNFVLSSDKVNNFVGYKLMP